MQFWFARAASCAVILGFVALLATPPAAAAAAEQSALVPAILVVDLPQVLHASKAGQSVQTTVGQAMQTYSKAVAHQEDDLQRARADLERQHTAMSQTALDSKAKALQLRYQELNRNVQNKRQAMQQAYNNAMLKVEKAAMDIVGQLAKERGANLVVLKQAVVFSPDSSDVTTEVLSRLDKDMATVQVDLPKIENSAATTSHRERRSSRQQQ
jgi:Skp family chaperone for outer membrane proteins